MLGQAKRQQGAILIIALLIVSVIAALAVDFTSRFQLSLGRAENRFFGAQMQESLFSLESAAKWALKEDAREDDRDRKKEYDHLGELWAKAGDYKVLIQAEFENVIIDELKIQDAQARFNINQLLDKNTSSAFDASLPFETRYTVQEKRFMRLLQAMPNDFVSLSEAEAITQALMDWLDANNEVTGSGGAESNYYLSQELPFRSANTLMTSVSELRLLRGMSEEIYEWLSPLVVALPVTNAGININTASVEVLQSLNGPDVQEPISLEDAELLESSRPVLASGIIEDASDINEANENDAFDSIQNFLNDNDVETVFGSDNETKPSGDGLTTGSDFFILSAAVEVDSLIRRSYSLLKREKDPRTNAIRVQVIKRGANPIF